MKADEKYTLRLRLVKYFLVCIFLTVILFLLKFIECKRVACSGLKKSRIQICYVSVGVKLELFQTKKVGTF